MSQPTLVPVKISNSEFSKFVECMLSSTAFQDRIHSVKADAALVNTQKGLTISYIRVGSMIVALGMPGSSYLSVAGIVEVSAGTGTYYVFNPLYFLKDSYTHRLISSSGIAKHTKRRLHSYSFLPDNSDDLVLGKII